MKIEWDEKKREKVESLINTFINKHEVTCGESVQQCDDPNIESVDLVGDIVDVLQPVSEKDPFEE